MLLGRHSLQKDVNSQVNKLVGDMVLGWGGRVLGWGGRAQEYDGMVQV